MVRKVVLGKLSDVRLLYLVAYYGLEGCMNFIPVLACKNCSQPIWLPPPTRSERVPSQSPWRWGNPHLTVACLSCIQAFEYSEQDCHWDQSPTPERVGSARMTVHQISVKCEVEWCVGRLQILVIAKPGWPPPEPSEIAASLYAVAIHCERGHEYSGPIEAPTGQSLSFSELKSF